MILLWIVIYKSTLKYLRNRMCFNIFLHGKQRIIYLSRIYKTCKLVSIYIQQKNKCSTILKQNTFIFIFNFSASFRCLLTYFSRIHDYALIFYQFLSCTIYDSSSFYLLWLSFRWKAMKNRGIWYSTLGMPS
mgnify:CR=1 FL=1